MKRNDLEQTTVKSFNFGTCPFPQFSPECINWHKQIQKLIDSLAIILDFVERWNKYDKEPDVADAAQFLSSIKGE